MEQAVKYFEKRAIQKRSAQEASAFDDIKRAINARNKFNLSRLSKKYPEIVKQNKQDLIALAEKSRSIPVIKALLSGPISESFQFSRDIASFIVKMDSHFALKALAELYDMQSSENHLSELAARNGSERSLQVILEIAHDKNLCKRIALTGAISARRSNLAIKLIEQGVLDNDPPNLSSFYPSYIDQGKMALGNQPFKSESALLTAVANEEYKVLDYLLERKIDSSPEMLYRALYIACRRQDSTAYSSLMAAGADVNYNNGTILYDAMRRNQFAQIAFLVKAGAAITSRHLSVYKQHESTFSEELDPQIDTRTKSQQELFFLMARNIFKITSNSLNSKFLSLHSDHKIRLQKTDAFENVDQLNLIHPQVHPIANVALQAASCACVLSNATTADTEAIFREIFQADIERVESTKGLSWKRYIAGIIDQHFPIAEFQDVVKEVAETLVLPLLFKNYYARARFGNAIQNFDQAVNDSRFVAARLLCDGKSSQDLFVLNAKWHRAGNRCPDKLRPYLLIGEWTPLFEGAVDLHLGYSIVCMHTPAQLKAEGSALSHCVGSYASYCRNGKHHILSLRKNGEPHVTIELVQSEKDQISFPSGSRWEIRQAKGYGNVPADENALRAIERFKFKVAEGEIPEIESEQTIARRKYSEHAAHSIVHSKIGYHIAEVANVRQSLIEHYDQRVFVERGGKKITLFSEKSKLDLEKMDKKYSPEVEAAFFEFAENHGTRARRILDFFD